MNGVRMTSLPASVGPAGPEAPDRGLVAGLPAVRLRCNCPCALCRDPVSGQRLLRPEEAVLREGLLLPSQVPADPGTVLEVAASLGYVRETNYGRLFDVRVETSPADLAFTSLPILPHTGNPYGDPVPTVQLLHCPHNAAGVGDSGFVDGFHAAAALRALDPAAFARLAVTPVTFRYRDAATELSATRPLISLDTRGRLREIRVNSRSLQPVRLPAAQAAAFYAAYQAFAELLARPAATRTARPRRHLQGCYADLDGIESAVAVGKRPAAGDTRGKDRT
jgi:gamma-butyrobetaine dioxygenase